MRKCSRGGGCRSSRESFSTAGELTASIAHEINQPLGAIRANAETMQLMVESATPNMSEVKEILADIRRDEERASEVILRLRSLLKKAPFESRDIEFNDWSGTPSTFFPLLLSDGRFNYAGRSWPRHYPSREIRFS
jgi:septation ring formation regulator EzrA